MTVEVTGAAASSFCSPNGVVESTADEAVLDGVLAAAFCGVATGATGFDVGPAALFSDPLFFASSRFFPSLLESVALLIRLLDSPRFSRLPLSGFDDEGFLFGVVFFWRTSSHCSSSATCSKSSIVPQTRNAIFSVGLRPRSKEKCPEATNLSTPPDRRRRRRRRRLKTTAIRPQTSRRLRPRSSCCPISP